MNIRAGSSFHKRIKAPLLALFAVCLCCLAGTGRAETAFGQLAGVSALEAAPAPAPARVSPAGALSFDQAAQLIISAREKVYLTALALPGDETGRRMAGLLKERRRAGLDVRLSVDGAEAEARRPLLRELAAQGVQVRVFTLSYCSTLVPYSRLLLTDGKFTDLDGGADAGSAFILPNQQASALEDAIVFFFTANGDGSEPKSLKIMSSCHGAPQGSPIDDSIVFFFTANDDGSTNQ